LVFFGNNSARKQKKVAKVSPKNFFSKKRSKSGLVWANRVKCAFLGYGIFDFFFPVWNGSDTFYFWVPSLFATCSVAHSEQKLFKSQILGLWADIYSAYQELSCHSATSLSPECVN
jgi:hypothetical protein